MASNTMFAWQVKGNKGGITQNLTLATDAPIPPMGKPGSTRIKVLRVSLNPVDYKVAELWLSKYIFGYPLTPVMDVVGRVVETTNPLLSPGDLVVGKHNRPAKYGGAAEYTVLGPSDTLVKIDEAAVRILDEVVATGVASGTALNALRPLLNGPPAKVFINGGSGGVGVWTVQIAKLRGHEVVATCSGRNVDFVKSLGADEVIDYTQTNVLEALKENVARTGRQFDHVVDNVSTDTQLYWKASEYLVPNAQFCFVGGYVSLNFFLEQLKITLLPKCLGGGHKILRITNNGKNEEAATAAQMLLEDKVKIPLQKFSLEDLPKAFEALKTGRTVGKIVVKISD